LARTVSDSDSVRRQNRGLVLGTLRSQGPLSRTALATETGLSHASITAISHDLITQKLIVELVSTEKTEGRVRGRPATLLGFQRTAGTAALLELDVNRLRLSLVDYGGVLVDRLEYALTPTTFQGTDPAEFIGERLASLRNRSPAAGPLQRIAISVQGIVDRDGAGLRWSPIAHLANRPFAAAISEATSLPVTLFKRGGLLAEGARWLDPSLRDASVATVFVGSTVAMGMTFRGHVAGRSDEGGTEFGHMNHIPNGALCRCGMRGCIEAYASDYGVLRAAYSVPETAAPAAAVPLAQYEGLIARAESGDRNAVHAFNLAGRAIGYGLSRLMAVFDPSHILLVGPGARAFRLMRPEIDGALSSTLVCRVSGTPEIVPHRDETEPIFKGLLMKTLEDIDQQDFAPLP
jgi:predicted NBD/HSP70 family sugar kinase